MNVTIKINTDNAAFETDTGIELARILRKLADQTEGWPGANEFTLRINDINGNRVGELKTRKS